jgi:hypothetical protein
MSAVGACHKQNKYYIASPKQKPYLIVKQQPTKLHGSGKDWCLAGNPNKCTYSEHPKHALVTWLQGNNNLQRADVSRKPGQHNCHIDLEQEYKWSEEFPP